MDNDPPAAVHPSDALPIRTIIAGLGLVAGIDLLTMLRVWPEGLIGWAVHTWVLLMLPWLSLLLGRKPVAVLGYRRGRLLLDLGWGVVAGAAWRLVSMLLNLTLVRGFAAGDFGGLFSALLWVPFVEETFFRGYLGRALQSHWGIWKGNLVQALLFTLQPYHWAQGWPGLVNVFGFGLLAGWLVDRRGTLWSAWAAHAAANVLAWLLMTTI